MDVCEEPRRTRKGGSLGTTRYPLAGLCSITLWLLHLAILTGAALAQNQPSPQPAPQQGDSTAAQSPQDQKPPEEKKNEEKKEESSNPAQAAAEKTKQVTVQAAQAAKQMGTAASGEGARLGGRMADRRVRGKGRAPDSNEPPAAAGDLPATDPGDSRSVYETHVRGWN